MFSMQETQTTCFFKKNHNFACFGIFLDRPRSLGLYENFLPLRRMRLVLFASVKVSSLEAKSLWATYKRDDQVVMKKPYNHCSAV